MKTIIAVMTGALMMNAYAHEVTLKVALSPAGSFEAKSDKVKGIVLKDGAKFTAENLWVKVDELKTGIDLRDEHFHKHLASDKFPKITFTQVTAADGKGSGTLTVDEVKKIVPFTYTMKTPTKLEVTINVKNSDFKLKEENYMGIGVKDDVVIVAIVDV
ncbi:MAG: YceI family protein [Bacteriovorax sp.]|nr:YceI family protein [Bacteriovorax sp.]